MGEDFPQQPKTKTEMLQWAGQLDMKRNDDVREVPIHKEAIHPEARAAIEDIRQQKTARSFEELDELVDYKQQETRNESDTPTEESSPSPETPAGVSAEVPDKIETEVDDSPEESDDDYEEATETDDAFEEWGEDEEERLPEIVLNLEPLGLPNEITEENLEAMQDLVDGFDEQHFLGTNLSGIEREDISRAHHQFADALAGIREAFYSDSQDTDWQSAVETFNAVVPHYAESMEKLYTSPVTPAPESEPESEVVSEPLVLTPDKRVDAPAEPAPDVETEPETEPASAEPVDTDEPETPSDSEATTEENIQTIEGQYGTSRYEAGKSMPSVVEKYATKPEANSDTAPSISTPPAREGTAASVATESEPETSTEPVAKSDEPEPKVHGYANWPEHQVKTESESKPLSKPETKVSAEEPETPEQGSAIERIVSRLGVSQMKVVTPESGAMSPEVVAKPEAPEVRKLTLEEHTEEVGKSETDTQTHLEAANSDAELRDDYFNAIATLEAKANQKAGTNDSEVMQVLLERFADDKNRLTVALDIGVKATGDGVRTVQYTEQQKQQFERDFQTLQKVLSDIETHASKAPAVDTEASPELIPGEAYRDAAIAELDKIDAELADSRNAGNTSTYQPVDRARLKKLMQTLRAELGADLRKEVASYTSDEKEAFDAKRTAIADLAERILEKETGTSGDQATKVPESPEATPLAKPEAVAQSPDELQVLKETMLEDVGALEATLAAERPGPGESERSYEPTLRVEFKNGAKQLRLDIEKLSDSEADITAIKNQLETQYQDLHKLFTSIIEREKQPVKKVVVESVTAPEAPTEATELPTDASVEKADIPEPETKTKEPMAPSNIPERDVVNQTWDDAEQNETKPEKVDTQESEAKPEKPSLFKREGEIEGTADKQMMRELAQYGVTQKLWERGALGGIGRALADTKLEAFQSQSRNEQLKARMQELITLAGREAPQRTRGITLGEYLPALYQAAARSGAFKK